MKPTYSKSLAGDLLMWSDLIFGPSFKVRQGQPSLKVLLTCVLLVLEVCYVKPTYRKSWAGNLLISDLALEQWFTGFGELSFWWIQICTGSPIC